MSTTYLSTKPYKGARDFFPEDMRIRNYIFSVWRSICERYGFEEYDFPIVENLEVFASKSGEEIVSTQLFSFADKGERNVALRPELTPSTVRMIADRYNELPKPIKWFMIGNNWRFEKPQKGRGREFYQLEGNIFGVEGVEADFEIFSLIVAIMKEFGANETMYRLYYSDRRLISLLLDEVLKLTQEQQLSARRIMDKRKKVTAEEFVEMLAAVGITGKAADTIEAFMNSTFSELPTLLPEKLLAENQGYQDVLQLEQLLIDFDLMKYCQFDPGIIRGFDYSDGLVYEVFDTNPENKRSMFGGERFDRLINVFGKFDMAATGFAMGDITLLEFLKGWNLLPELPTTTRVLVTRFPDDNPAIFTYAVKIAQQLRENGISVSQYPTKDKLEKQLKYAEKLGIPFVVIAGEGELENNTVKLKELKKRAEQTLSREEMTKVLVNS